MVKEIIISRKPTVQLTAEVIRKELNCSESLKHRITRIYSDGTYYMNDVGSRIAVENAAYNLLYRGEAAIIMDGVLIHKGFDDWQLKRTISNLERRGVEFTLPTSQEMIA